jgi:hypothetical protein
MTYRVLHPFLALLNEQHRFKTIMEDTIITVNGPPMTAGLVDAMYEGEVIAVFMRDVQNYCEPIEEQSEPNAFGNAV